MRSKLKLDETPVAKIIEIAMSNNEKCKTCKFRGMCFFAYSCLSNNYKYYLKERTEMIRELKNWTETTKGLYRYVVGASVCYEIHIMYHAKDTDILTANASLYIVGDWFKPVSSTNFFERKLLLNGPVAACLEKAAEDEKEMGK